MTTQELADRIHWLRDLRTSSHLRATQFVERVPGLGPCWEWTMARDQKGYGQVWHDDGVHKVHRDVAKAAGIIPPDAGPEVQTRHRCDNPPCFNPAHLLPGSNADNQTDSVQRARHKSASRTHCPKGHPYADHINTSVEGKHRRRCLICEKEARPRRRKGDMSRF